LKTSNVFFLLGVVYYTLGNINPKLRSQCDAIQLLLIATTPVIKKYGIDVLLDPFMDDLKYLEQVCFSLSIKQCFNLSTTLQSYKYLLLS
jgi:hypothetical protein